MKINYLYIDGYKNLNDFEINFAENSSVNVLIGNNGSGKSNTLEALTVIFSSVINEKPPEGFIFDIHYTIDENIYQLSNKEGFIFLKNSKKLAKNEYKTSLPKNLFLYYCGETDRLEKISIISTDKAFETALKKNNGITLKYVSYIKLQDFSSALLSNAVFKNSTYEKICSLINIENITTPITIHIKRPDWSKSAPITQDSFWNAQGTVAFLLHSFKDIGRLDIIDKDTAHIIVDDFSKIKSLAENPLDLFIKLKLLMQADILENISFDIVKNGLTISIDDLSEGEKQLAQLLSILEAVKEYKALFLLDEFDAYLHPNWQRKFVEIISNIEIRGQVLFTTHSPMTLGKMQKENIIILKDGKAFTPSADTFNRDITEVLEEIMDVGKRPKEVEIAIYNFREAAMANKKETALTRLDTVKKLLSEDDPFLITAQHMMARLER